MTADPQLREVRLLGFPLRVYARTNEHMEELMREFALLTVGRSENEQHGQQPSQQHSVPARLLALVDVLTEQFGGITEMPDRTRDEALDRGEEFIDLTYYVPVEAAAASRDLATMLDEVDEYCRSGDLLTLATPAEGVTFREWYLQEFVAQLGGAAPTPWPDYVAARA